MPDIIGYNITTGAGEVANHVPELWAQEAIGYFKGTCVMPKLIKTAFAGVKSGQLGYDKFNVPKRGALTVREKTTDTDISTDSPDDSLVTISVDKHKYVAFEIEDVASAMVNQDIFLGYVQDAAKKLAEHVDEEILKLANDFSQTVGLFTTQVTEADWVKARKLLRKKKVPKSDPLWFVGSPKCEEELAKIARYTEADKLGEAGRIVNGQMGRWHGVETVISELIEVDGAGTDQANNLMFHRDSIGYLYQQLPRPRGPNVDYAIITDPDSGVSLRWMVSYRHNGMADLCTLDMLFGFAELNDDFGVWFKTQESA